MKYLMIMGKSGSGKTTLAEKIEAFKPKDFKRIVQFTTREMRANETEGKEYYFVTRNDFIKKDVNEDLVAKVYLQYPPSFYGTPISDLEKTKTNIIVASIEGLLDFLVKTKNHSEITILNINEVVEADAKRDGRDADSEEVYNSIFLNYLKQTEKKIKIIDLPFSLLKTIRDDNKQLLKFLKLNKIK